MKIVLLLLASMLMLPLFAQKSPNLSKVKNQQQKLQLWADYCDELVAIENFSLLRTEGKKGLKMTSKTDFVNQSLFLFYVGVTFDYLTEADSAAYYIEKSEHFARKASNRYRTLEALKQLSSIYQNYGSKAKRERVLSEFRRTIDTTSSAFIKGNMYQHLGDYYINTGSYEKGLDYFLKGAKIRRLLLPKASESDSINFGVQLIKIAELYIGLDNHLKALEYLKESEPFIQSYKEAIAHVKKDFITVYLIEDDLENASKQYHELERFLEREDCFSCWIMLIESDLPFAEYYRDQGNYTKALQAIDHARLLAPKYADEFANAQIDYTHGTICLELKDYKKALGYLKSAEPFTNDDDPEVNSRLLRSLAETYAGLQNWEMAYSYHRRYSALQDKLLSEKAKKNLAEVEGLYQNEKKQAQIIELSSKNTINDLTIKNANRQLFYLIIGFIFAIAIGVLIYFQSRNRKKNNVQLQQLNAELEQANAIKMRFFSILNHDLRSPVANLIHFLQLQQHNPELLDEASKERLGNSTLTGAENLLNSMEDMLLWSKGQMENFKPVPANIQLSNLFNDIKQHFQSEERVRFEFEVEQSLHVFTDENYLKTILRNLTSNALKALEKSENPTILWKASVYDNHVLCVISDNGPGANQAAFKALYDETEVVGIKTGLGLHLVRDLASAIDCEISVETGSSGTAITLSLPVR
ncbi:MAG: HAMP domain-containing sensor histidine kinase [Fluviicola sp.]|nr:HAMP domain-containing sensor histidine kinase [Fluviicola sp.]